MPRRKRAVVQSSDDEYEGSPETRKGSIQAAFARAKQASNTPSPSKPTSLPTKPIPSPTKPKPGPKSKAKQSTKNGKNTSPAKAKLNPKSIHSFFNNATQRQKKQVTESPEKTSVYSLDLEDDIIDSSGDEKSRSASVNPVGIKNGLKRKSDALEDESHNSAPRPGLKFLRPNGSGSVSSQSSAPLPTKRIEQRPWTDQYGPVGLHELAVHKRKVQDVKDWLARIVAGDERKRLLVLKGGAGTGKTTTVNLIARELDLRVSEWRNPESIGMAGAGSSLAAQFEEFVARTSIFGPLSFGDESQTETQESKTSSHVLLVEEFPNTYSKSSSTLQGFRRAILHYLEASTPPLDDFFSQGSSSSPIVPIVMVISESLLTTSTASADSFTAHRLLGPEILSHSGTTVIEFNPIAPTFMAKALDLVLKKEARKSGRRFAPGPAVLRHLSETGDVRSAISSLEFFCVHQGGEADWSGKIQFTKSKKGAGETTLTSMEKQSLQMITQRENTLGIFHAVGKVVYNKREAPSATDTPPPQPPVWLPEYHRPKASEVDVDSLLNELGTDISSFILALHENYPLSCNGSTEEETIDSLNGCLDSLSDSDLLCPDRWDTNHSRLTFQGTTTDALRQGEISFDTSVRGILFNLPHPVKRLNPPSEYSAGRGKAGRGNTAFQMMYPASLRLWRKREQIEELVNLFNAKFRKGQFHADMRTRDSKQQTLGGVDAWRKYARFPGSLGPNTSESHDEQETDMGFLLRGASKTEMLLARLPYFSQIERRKSTSARTAMSKQLDRVVAFGGLSSLLVNEEDEDEIDAVPSEQWSTDKPVEEKASRAKGRIMKVDGHVVQKNIERLVLSDDDIEDIDDD